MSRPSTIPSEIDPATGLPEREVASAVSSNPDPDRVEAARAFAIEAARTLSDDRCEQVMVLDLREQSQITDFMVIGSGTSERQMRSAAFHVEEQAHERGLGTFRSNLKETPTSWVFLDLVDVVVHLFDPETRSHYDLEMLWGDAPRLTWERGSGGTTGPERNRAGLKPGDLLETPE